MSWFNFIPAGIIPLKFGVQFDGVNDSFEESSTSTLYNCVQNEDFYIECWMYRVVTRTTTILATQNAINVDTDIGMNFFVSATNRLQLLYLTGSTSATRIESSFAVPINSWQHIVVRRQSNIWDFFLNGVKYAATVSGPAPTGAISNASPQTIGGLLIGQRRLLGFRDYFYGRLSGIAIQKGSVPSDSEVLFRYNNPCEVGPSFYRNAQGAWLCQDAASPLRDRSPSANDLPELNNPIYRVQGPCI